MSYSSFLKNTGNKTAPYVVKLMSEGYNTYLRSFFMWSNLISIMKKD
jgi:hypothetical protein